MPKIKIDHVISFSSEDTKHIANNLLNTDTSKKWLCKSQGEACASILFQLEKATKISGVDIGNEKSAFVEVLVGRSSFQESEYKPLLAMSSFMTPMEAQTMSNCNRVRLFKYSDFDTSARDEKWDRVKIMCKQPFNKFTQYGLAMVTLHSPQENTDEPGTVSLGKFVLRPSSPDSLKAGSLFEKRKELTNTSPKLSIAQEIKLASTQEWQEKNGSPKCRIGNIKPSTSNSGKKATCLKNRNAIDSFYDPEDDEPNEKIDKLVEQKKLEDAKKKTDEEKSKKKNGTEEKKKVIKKEKQTPKNNQNVQPNGNKRKPESDTVGGKKIKLVEKTFNEFMKDVVFTISGIVNPERANLRQMAMNMGARYKPDWDSSCTHLICAFANTPKFQQVKGKGKIVKKSWITDCNSQRRRLPWRRYALDRDDIGKPESEDEICEKTETPTDDSSNPGPSSLANNSVTYNNDNELSSDTEDEIERVLSEQKLDDPKDNAYDCDTDEEKVDRKPKDIPLEQLNVFQKEIFHIDDVFGKNEKLKLECTIKALNGVVSQKASHLIDFIITDQDSAEALKVRFPKLKLVSPSWVYECYEGRKIEPVEQFLLV